MRSLSLGTPRASYRPIADYGAIGAGRSVALVSSDGSVDWWCPGRFDAPSVFGALLDVERGGFFRVAPTSLDAAARTRYLPDTNVLETVWTSATGTLRVVDLVPFPEDVGSADDVLVRRVEATAGVVEVEVVLQPRFQYGRVAPRLARAPLGTLARGAGEALLLTGADLAVEGGAAHVRIVLRAGERLDLVLRHSPLDAPVPFAAPLALPLDEIESRTVARWRDWSLRTVAEGADAPLVRRSALALKLLQCSRNGAIVAAATTSLPEEVGGVRNWDYRYAWLRDGALSALALDAVGHSDEAEAFATWLVRTLAAPGEMRILYSVSGGADLDERELAHLEGHRRSRPVRIGNAAVSQHQLDVYGEVIDLVAALPRAWTAETWAPFRRLADAVAARWREPDSGIWEMRSAPQHFVLSKAMVWLALTRAAQLARRHGLEGDVDAWLREAEAVRADVLANGCDPATGAFVQAYGSRHQDASNLLLPLIGFVDANDPRMVATVDDIVARLVEDGLVYRYRGTDDGVRGGEATFAYCTFWLVEVLARQGRVREARALFDRLAARASPLGLFAEEIDAATGEHLGNYPQGFPHAGLIQAARALHAAERSLL